MGANPRARNFNMETPLHRVATPDIVGIMLHSTGGADIDARNKQGYSALHFAVVLKNLSVFKALLLGGANPNLRDNNGRSCLDYACAKRQESFVGMLVEIGKVDVNSADSIGITALHLADGKAVIDMLVDAGADLHARDVEGKTPLHYSQTNISLCALLNRGADINATDTKGQTPLHLLSIVKDDAELLFFLLKKGADIHGLTRKGKTPLHLAAQRGRFHMAHALILSGARCDAMDFRGVSPLTLAAANGHAGIATLIIGEGVVVNTVDAIGQTPLHYAAFAGQLGAVQALICAGGNPTMRTRRGQSSIDMAIRNKHTKVAIAMIRAEFDYSTGDKCGRTALHHSVTNGLVEVARELLVAGGGVHAGVRDLGGMNPLDLAALNGQEGIADLLIESGVSVTADNQEGLTALHHATQNAHIAIARALMDAGADPTKRNVRQVSPLDMAVGNGNTDLVTLMIEKGADVRVHDNNGITALHLAWSEPMFEVLMGAGAGVDEVNDEGNTPLMYQLVDADPGLVRAHVRHGANLNLQNDKGESPLHMATDTMSREHMFTVVDLLLRAGADETLKDIHGFIPEDYFIHDQTPEASETKRLLQAAPRDRAWRRRALLLMGMSLHGQDVAVDSDSSDQWGCLVHRLVDTRERLDGIFRKIVMYL